MKKILVTGSEGQLGKSLKLASDRYNQFSYSWIDIQDVNLINETDFNRFFEANRFDYIINCAAFTAVDLAETNPETAFAVNEKLPLRLASVCDRQDAYLIHISTDYVYDGNRCLPHTEDEEPGPASVYAKSKLEGEKHLWNRNNTIILRTSWLYSEYGNNFLKTMMRLSEKNEIGVIYDQIGTPTYAGDLAGSILDILVYCEQNGFANGIYNYTNEGVCSWFDFAVEIMNLTNSKCLVRPLRTEEYPSPVKRPAYSVLDKSRIKLKFGVKINYWKDSLITAIRNLNNT